MKKIILSVAIVATNLVFSQQITLQNTFTLGERAFAFAKGNDMVYVTKGNGNNKLNIYNSAYVLTKTVDVPLPTGYALDFWYDAGQYNYSISRHIFNSDDKLEFVVSAKKASATSPNGFHDKLLLINEEGILIKDFTPNVNISHTGQYDIYHDAVSNTNKIIIENIDINNNPFFEVYGLPTSVLASKEIQKVNKLIAFPIPTSKILNITNPENGSNKVEIYDTSGKLILNKTFGAVENNIAIDVENLVKGTYFYKIGELTSKFVKN